MKKYAKLVLASLFVFSVSAMAQEQTPPQGREGGQNGMRQGQGPRQQLTAKMRAESMAKDLNLNNAETAKVQAVYEKNDSVFNKFRSQVNRNDPDFRTKFKALRDAQDAELESVIGKEKFEAWQKMRTDRRPPMNNNRPTDNVKSE
jgi:hypothetical protein